jgi:leukotriene-A4 hydrolase
VIERVVEASSQIELGFHFTTSTACFGTALEINLATLDQLSEKLELHVTYRTSPTATALQWMEANCTMGKQHPYLFSQCQAIHARSIIPCQDTPLVKFTYSAKVGSPAAITVLMSALHTKTVDVSADLKEFHFEQSIPIPSYLLALAAGALVSKDLGERSRVWTEKEMIDRAAYEFAEVEKMLSDAEDLMGPYVWGRYDLLVLPPTFPYGGESFLIKLAF